MDTDGHGSEAGGKGGGAAIGGAKGCPGLSDFNIQYPMFKGCSVGPGGDRAGKQGNRTAGFNHGWTRMDTDC